MILSLAIFDLDGTVLDNEETYGKAFSYILKKLGVKRINSTRPHTRGIGVSENWPILIKKYKIKTNKSIDELTVETQREYMKLAKDVEVKEGFEVFASELKESGVLLALATSNTWPVVEAVFDTTPIEKYFDVVTTGEETFAKKPDPEIFLLTADKLGIKPEDCLVFEDSRAGIKAALEAGMKAVGIKDEEDEDLDGTSLTIESFEELNPSIVSSL
jgi:HAD superfamily hydrolase (TIGR01509 family)